MTKLKKGIGRIIDFVTLEVWHIRLADVDGRKGFLLRQIRTILLTIKGFRKDNIQLRASALTLYSLLSIVPLLAMIFGIAKGFGLREYLQKELARFFSGQEEVLKWSLHFADSTLENTNSGLIAGIGLPFLIWTTLQLLGNIETSFNHIWGIKESRNFVRKFTDYFSILFLSPILLILSSSLNVFISTKITSLVASSDSLEMIKPAVQFLLKLTPYTLIWLMLTLVYMIMPNTKVKFKNALIGGIIAGTIYQLVQWGYINFQVGASRYSAVYGSFAALPLFLIWLQISWLIILLGTEISYANQNVGRFEYISDEKSLSHNLRRKLALLLTARILKTFQNGEDPNSVESLSEELEIPAKLIRNTIQELMDCRIVNEVKIEQDLNGFAPAMSIDRITINYVLNALDNKGQTNISLPDTEEIYQINLAMETFNEHINQLSENKLLKDLNINSLADSGTNSPLILN